MGRNVVRALAVAVALLLGLAGCSLFSDPPDGLIEAADEYASAVRALPGVSDAKADVTAVDQKDRPGEWRVNLVVTAISVDGLESVTDGVWSIQPPAGAVVAVTLRYPEESGLAPVSLGDPSTASAERARVLRVLPFVESVALSGTEVSLLLADGTRLDDAAAAIRATDVLAADPYDSVRVGYATDRVTIGISLAGPSAAVVSQIEVLAGDPGVQRVSSVEPTRRLPRPQISVQTSDPAGVSSGLAGVRGDGADGRPRTAFMVTGGTSSVAGFVGLPIGTAEPDDLPLALDGRDPTPPAVLAAHLAADAAALRSFLVDTIEASGAPGSPETYVVPCVEPGLSRVEGYLLAHVFEVAETTYPAYDAITAVWEAGGFDHTDQATGTSIYTSTVTRGVVQASIVGTTDGIQISAFTECRG